MSNRCLQEFDPQMLHHAARTWDTLVGPAASRWPQVRSRWFLAGAIAATGVGVLVVAWPILDGLPLDVLAGLSLFAIALLAMLFLAAAAGRTIGRFRSAAQESASRASALAAQNESLQRRIDTLYVRTAQTHEAFLRRVGSELHDGPAQLIAFALLRLDSLSPGPNRAAAHDDYDRIKSALADSLADIRSISAGLILPELEAVSPAEVLRLAARNHERRTGTNVRCEIENLPLKLSPTLKSCLYRFTQGALSNAYQHASGIGQMVRGTHRDGVVEIAIVDGGAGFDPGSTSTKEARLGLIGMRDNVTSLGGTFDLSSQPGAGTRVTARFEISDRPET